MEIKLISLLVIAHFLSDFIFQTQKMSDTKEVKIFTSHHIYHALIVGMTSYVLSFDIGFWKAAIILAIIHLLTDILKSWFVIKNRNRKRIGDLFFIDQLIHLIFIVFIALVYSRLCGVNFWFDFNIKTVAIIGGFIFCAKPSNIIIKYLFIAFSIQIPGDNLKEQSLPNAGKLIGVAERFMALALIIMGQYGAVGLIIAAKSILRFNRTSKNEYVLVGTLLSFSMAIFSGILITIIE